MGTFASVCPSLFVESGTAEYCTRVGPRTENCILGVARYILSTGRETKRGIHAIITMEKEDLNAALVNRTEIPFALEGRGLSGSEISSVRYLEVLFIIMVAAVMVAVFYFLPYKIAFLNFSDPPVLSAAYFLGRRKAVMCAVLCLLSGVLFAWYKPDGFAVR